MAVNKHTGLYEFERFPQALYAPDVVGHPKTCTVNDVNQLAWHLERGWFEKRADAMVPPVKEEPPPAPTVKGNGGRKAKT
jgi:hypothetical protein